MDAIMLYRACQRFTNLRFLAKIKFYSPKISKWRYATSQLLPTLTMAKQP